MQEDIKKACEILKNGGIILYPTDTIWGLAAMPPTKKPYKRV